MIDFLRTPQAQAVIWVTAALILTIIAVFALRNWRDRVKQEDTTSDQLTKFRDLRQRGVLEEEEFRTIKTALSNKLRNEIKSEGDQG